MLISFPRNYVSSPNVLSAMSRFPEPPLLENNSSLNNSLVTFIIQIHCCFINYIIQVRFIKIYIINLSMIWALREMVCQVILFLQLNRTKKLVFCTQMEWMNSTKGKTHLWTEIKMVWSFKNSNTNVNNFRVKRTNKLIKNLFTE